jgi:pyruvate-ferredoxin/flavodoxin oxidoreductase
MSKAVCVLDANEAVARVAHRTHEVIAIYPITPASPIGEYCDTWSAQGQTNLWGEVPRVSELQAEGGAAGAVHGALQAGALTTTFTASQGLLLMLPNMYKIAGELLPICLHVAARTVATHALSIFGDHSDVMACRQAGWMLLCSGSPQEAQDFALIGQAASLKARVPVLHFFDGFRTSHELQKVELLDDDDYRALLDEEAIAAHKARALSPEAPVLRGAAQNPDTFFQCREAQNPFYDAAPDIVQAQMNAFAAQTGRQYHLFDYVGHPDAERVIVMMGSGAETAHETVDRLVARGERVGLLKVRLYRPLLTDAFLAALPPSAERVAVLDRTKEPGAPGEPLYLDVVAALARAGRSTRVVGGRYGLSGKAFTPPMVEGVFAHLEAASPRHDFTVGIVDDVTERSLPMPDEGLTEPDDVARAVFFGLGSDGTVGSNKNTAKIIGEETDHHAQGFFVYDSKKAGAVTVSHLRFSKRPIRSTYLIEEAHFVACHQPQFLDRIDMLRYARPGGRFLVNSPLPPDALWASLPGEVQRQIVDKGLEVWAIDAYRIAGDVGLGRRISTVMQACFFHLEIVADGLLDAGTARARLETATRKSYGKRGEEVVRRNLEAIDRAQDGLVRVPIPEAATSTVAMRAAVPDHAPDFVQRVTGVMLAGRGDALPVSVFPVDGTWPTATSQYEKRTIARDIPAWHPDLCIQCSKCSILCPHAAIRPKLFEDKGSAPPGFLSMENRFIPGFDGHQFALQVAPDDCTGCGLCVEVCPARDKAQPRRKALEMVPADPVREAEREHYAHFLALPEATPTTLRDDVRGSQLRRPLFEYSGACAGCGETPYVKLLTQLFGDRALIANATGCSSIYGGNLPTTPYCTNDEGRGPAWANSLFEDNAEFGFGFRLAVDAQEARVRGLLKAMRDALSAEVVSSLLADPERTDEAIAARRAQVAALRQRLRTLDTPKARELDALCDVLVPRSLWIVGGDGWAYDIGYGGLDHVLASNANVNILVLDTEVYSNTGGQASKATPLGAVAKFAAGGKSIGKKDLGMLAMTYGHVYVAQVALGAKDKQTVQAFLEAERHPGPSLIVAYSPCIAHGYDLKHGTRQQKMAVDSGFWPLYRFDPARAERGEAPLVLDAKKTRTSVRSFMEGEGRFRVLALSDPKRFKILGQRAEEDAARRLEVYQQLADIRVGQGEG